MLRALQRAWTLNIPASVAQCAWRLASRPVAWPLFLWRPHRENDHRHAFELEPPLNRVDDLVVQQPREPVFVREHQFRGEEHDVRKFGAGLVAELYHLLHAIHAKSKIVLRRD